jgi:hypothetical protein
MQRFKIGEETHLYWKVITQKWHQTTARHQRQTGKRTVALQTKRTTTQRINYQPPKGQYPTWIAQLPIYYQYQ